MKSSVGVRKCNSKFAMCILDRLNAYPTRKRELRCLRNARRSARLRDRNRGFDRKTVGSNSCELAQALLHKRHLKIPGQARWICQGLADSAMFRIMQRNRWGFLIFIHMTLVTTDREIGLVVVAAVGTDFRRILLRTSLLAVSMAMARSHMQQRRQLPKGNHAA